MAACETCRFWKRLTERDAKYYGVSAEYGECGAVLAGDARREPGRAIMVTDGDGPTLLTRPDFGCVLHELGV